MKKRSLIRKICLISGAAMILTAMVALVYWQWNISHSQKQAQAYVQTMQTLIPAPRPAVPEARRDNTMSTLAVDGRDFVGLLEFPRFASVLPVCDDWGRSTQHPCRFGGSIYDGSLQIGATTQEGQYSFYREISIGDTVVFTDVEGNRYTLRITSMSYEDHVDPEALQKEEGALVLFVKNIYSFEYLVIFCQV